MSFILLARPFIISSDNLILLFFNEGHSQVLGLVFKKIKRKNVQGRPIATFPMSTPWDAEMHSVHQGHLKARLQGHRRGLNCNDRKQQDPPSGCLAQLGGEKRRQVQTKHPQKEEGMNNSSARKEELRYILLRS